MHWPQIVMIVFLALSFGEALAKDGEPKTGNHSFIITLVAIGIEVAVLYFGGFFS